MVKSAQMVKLAAWVLPDPENAENNSATIAGTANKYRAWLELLAKAHPELQAEAEDLIKPLELYIAKHGPGPSKPVESTPSSPAVLPASSGSPIESLQTERLSLVEVKASSTRSLTVSANFL